MKYILVTGAAGFIGGQLVEKLLRSGYKVVGIDNFDPFYDKSIKLLQLNKNLKYKNFVFFEEDILNDAFLNSLNYEFDIIIHLAAKAGVRPSIEDPLGYQNTNVNGTLKLLEYSRKKSINKFIFASSSSVYGINKNFPWSENDFLMPISPYASTKLSCEMLGHVYSSLYNLQFIGLRFFTVYGPGQRPDLAIHKFFKLIYNNLPIQIYGDGTTQRDYTYIDDIINGIIFSINYNNSKYEIFNLGNNKTQKLNDLISLIENVTCKKAILKYLPEQPGDVPITFASVEKSLKLLNYNPSTDILQGLENFNIWYLENFLKNE
jgi:UDP-glucuronate 4-epimerase